MRFSNDGKPQKNAKILQKNTLKNTKNLAICKVFYIFCGMV